MIEKLSYNQSGIIFHPFYLILLTLIQKHHLILYISTILPGALTYWGISCFWWSFTCQGCSIGLSVFSVDLIFGFTKSTSWTGWATAYKALEMKLLVRYGLMLIFSVISSKEAFGKHSPIFPHADPSSKTKTFQATI